MKKLIETCNNKKLNHYEFNHFKLVNLLVVQSFKIYFTLYYGSRDILSFTFKLNNVHYVDVVLGSPAWIVFSLTSKCTVYTDLSTQYLRMVLKNNFIYY